MEHTGGHARVDRQRLIEVPEHQHTVRERELQFAAFEDAAVLIAEDRDEQLGVQLRLDRVQSTSKKSADEALGPFSSRSFQRALFPVPIPMWLGTKSTTCRRPCAAAAAVNSVWAGSPPTSGLIWLWSATS